MKRTIVSLFLIILAATAQVEAHAFLREAEPAVVARSRHRRKRFESDLRKKSNQPSAASRYSMRPGRKWTNAMCTWITRITRCCTSLCLGSASESTRSFGAWFLLIHT
jgi:hypothetical protein